MKYIKHVTTLLTVVLLNGCFEVEDNSSDVKALLDQAENSVSIKGVVVDALDLKPIGNALITVKVGSTEVVSNFEVTDGDFELTGLPRSSDIDIIISSPDNKFLPRTFFTQTAQGSKDGIEDVGSFAVSEPVDVEISVINNETGNALSTLEFIAYSHSGANSSAYKYQHVSSFDVETGVYTITLPKFINTSISANLDFDKDGAADYVPELSNFLHGRNLYIGSANTKEFSRIHVNEVPVASDLEIRLSLVDETAEPLLDATFYIEDSVVESTYDESTSQYVITTQLKDRVSLQLPAFTSNEIKYQSSSFTISKLADGNLNIIKNGSSNNCCFAIPNTAVIDLALAPQVIIESETPLEVVLAATEVNPLDSSFSVFYSQAVAVELENISLTNSEGFTVLKGNADSSDQVAAGTTHITGGLSFPVTFALSLNDTRLTVTPVSPLTVSDSYRYDIQSVTNKATLERADIYNDQLTFEINPSTDEVFSAADIKLDNENYTTNGSVITASNSAGVSSSSSNWNGSVYLYFPLNINALQKLTLRKTSVNNDGISSISSSNYNVVTDGQIHMSAVGVAKLAANESVLYSSMNRSVILNSAQAETQKVYRLYAGEYLSDNTSSEANSISFEYSLETKAGEVATGNITIPVQ
ncbi:hypothetical protein [Colwellia psychrerythraea]|uniref:Uncharacterized protein n=1 Tax=Colwellia psychrerythraea TaxID=28229 RepID=A0A099KI28_COLPS|nr:hypothetical protein [Colwellia psychrerythraea]KGJ90016.1 hypothetical protein ND2E_3572 [Colwellia psychrerythraea]